MKPFIFSVIFVLAFVLHVYAGTPFSGSTESIFDIQAEKPPRHNLLFPYSGIFSLTEANLGFGLSGSTKPYSERFFGITSVIGYQYNTALFIGVGAGMADYTDGQMIPIFLHARCYFNGINLTPFISGDVGMLYHMWGAETSKRTFVNPAAGISVNVSKNTTLTCALGLFTQWGKNVQSDSFVTLKFGLLFF